MRIIEGITNNPFQENTITLDDGSQFTIELKFVPMQLGWFIERLTYEDFTLNGFRICNSPNILHQFRNFIPFGIACQSIEDREPSLENDFQDRNTRLYLLTREETLEYARFLSEQV